MRVISRPIEGASDDDNRGATGARVDAKLLSAGKTLGAQCRIPSFHSWGFRRSRGFARASRRVCRVKGMDRKPRFLISGEGRGNGPLGNRSGAYGITERTPRSLPAGRAGDPARRSFRRTVCGGGTSSAGRFVVRGHATLDGRSFAFGTGGYRPLEIGVPDLSHQRSH